MFSMKLISSKEQLSKVEEGQMSQDDSDDDEVKPTVRLIDEDREYLNTGNSDAEGSEEMEGEVVEDDTLEWESDGASDEDSGHDGEGIVYHNIVEDFYIILLWFTS